jgi:hypothetical protein
LFTLGQAMIWFQTNLQFFNTWAKNNTFAMAALFSVPISYILIKATYFVVTYFNGAFWPGRLIGFGSGILVFAILTYNFNDEGINTKTLISLILAIALIAVQIFCK